MSTYVLLSEDEPIVDFVAQIESILNESSDSKKPTKGEDVKSPSVNPEEEEDEEEEKEKEAEKEGKDEEKEEDEKDEEKEKSDEEESSKKKKAPKKAPKKKPAPKPKEDSPWMKLAKENKILDVLDQAFIPNFQKFLNTNEADADTVFLLAFFLLQQQAEKNPKTDWRGRVVKLINLFATQEEKKKEKEEKYSEDEKENKETQLLARLRWFSTFYDSFSDDKYSDLRYSIFTALLSFVSWSKLTAQVIESLTVSNYEKVIQIWKLNSTEQRSFSLLLTNLHIQHQRQTSSTLSSTPTPISEETQKHRIQYLKTFETPLKGEDLEKTTEHALGAIVHALFYNSLVDIHTLRTFRVIENLSKHKEHNRALRLLTIFAKESYDSYEKFYKENTAYIAELGLNHKHLLSHIRTLTLCSLGASAPTLSYEVLQKAFGVSSTDEVEEIVLDAVVEGRVEAKVDQEKSEVAIYRTSPRSFELSSWQNLSDQLDAWKENVSQVLAILQRAQSQQMPAQPTGRSGGSKH